ncbi:MAG: hypothetical protein HGGPFJEG_00602 [Ignavibacteria bacterium]|nr:hypothetical protein [Ignavibacteria bacterium]
MKHFLKYVIEILLLLILILTIAPGCGKDDKKTTEKHSGEEKEIPDKKELSSAGVKEHGVEFSIEYELPRKFYKIEKVDLNSDGKNEIIVFSTLKDSVEKFVSFYNFDMIEIFVLDSALSKYKKVLSDTVDYSENYYFEDLAKNGIKQILIQTNSGGNDAVASRGMFIYEMDRDAVRLVKYFDTGDPVLKDLKNDGRKEILVTDVFWGIMPHVNVIYYTAGIYKYENGDLKLVNPEFGEYYEGRLKELKEKYYGIKKKVEMGMQPVDLSYPLYREAAEVFVNYIAKGDLAGLKKFWDEEKNSLKDNLPEDEFKDLENYIGKSLPSEQNV